MGGGDGGGGGGGGGGVGARRGGQLRRGVGGGVALNHKLKGQGYICNGRPACTGLTLREWEGGWERVT